MVRLPAGPSAKKSKASRMLPGWLCSFPQPFFLKGPGALFFCFNDFCIRRVLDHAVDAVFTAFLGLVAL